jgi:hypothetical protein
MAARTFGFCPLRIALAVFCLLAGVSSGGSQGSQRQHSPQTGTPQPIYAKNPDDSWNRIFYCLFSRRVSFRYSNEFPEGVPFSPPPFLASPATRNLEVSTHIFERFESGDRAIDPLYPIDPQYPGQILIDPLYTQLTEALREAQNDNTERPALARALMQSDLWSAFDILDVYPLGNRGEQRELLLGMLARLIKKIALSPAEIESLPNNFSLSVGKSKLPDLFRPKSGWIEIQWHTPRDHDTSSRFRRVSRVFLKPAHLTADPQAFLDSLRGPDQGNTASALDGVAIVTQLLLIDSQGRLTPSRITSEAQLRFFAKRPDGHFKATETRSYELSRCLALSHGGSGGFIVEGDGAPAYLPAAGNDFVFASRQFTHAGADPPLLVKSRTRCAACHGSDLTSLISFASHTEPTATTPHVTQLNPAFHEAADFVISQKTARQDWKDLLDYADIASPH